MTTRIACSPLTGNIHMGKVDRTGSHFTGAKIDVTSDVLGAIIEKARYHGGEFIIEGDDQKWTITVVEEKKA